MNLSTNSDAAWVYNGTNINNVNSGNVGIGTTSPARTLDLSTSGQITFGDNVNPSGGNTSRPGIFWHETYSGELMVFIGQVVNGQHLLTNN